jgi:hypothetical protein
VNMIDIDGVQIPARIPVRATVNGHAVEITAEYDPDAGRYVARAVEVRAGDGAEMTGEALRSIPVATILRDGVMSALQTTLLLGEERPPADAGKAGPTTENFRWVARIYRFAVLLGANPTQAVADGLDIPRSTAGRWVTRARDRGLLTVVDPRASSRTSRA